MNRGGKLVISVIVLFILLVSLSSYFVLATETNTKSYDSSTRTVTVKNANTEIAKITLNTPIIYSVIRGKDRLVAEFTIDNYASASNIYNTYNTVPDKESQPPSGNGVIHLNNPTGTGGVIQDLLSRGNLVVIIVIIGGILITFIISKTIIKLKKR
jgi:hypothetical protein